MQCRDSLYILLSLTICQRSDARLGVHEWKPEGLDLSAGPVPAFPSVCFTENREVQHMQQA